MDGYAYYSREELEDLYLTDVSADNMFRSFEDWVDWNGFKLVDTEEGECYEIFEG